jgi:hypothetical protein
MRFEAKHSFFKRVVRHTHNFRNILSSLAVKHQLMAAFHGNKIVQPSFQVSKMSTIDVSVLKEDIMEAVQSKFPGEFVFEITNTVCYSGTSYSSGMILTHGSTGGLPDFVELTQIAVVSGRICFIVKCLHAWYVEHLGSFVLENSRSLKVIEPNELSDIIPLAAYMVAGKPMVTLKHYVHTQ